jgi:long-chain acyl-CoA synthetase
MNCKRLFELVDYQLSKFPLQSCMVSKGNGEWKPISTARVIELSKNIAGNLLEKKVRKEDKIAIVAANRPEWVLADLAIQQSGAISVPLYPTITEEDYSFIFEEAEVKMVFVGDKDLFVKVSNACKKLKTPVEIICFEKVQGAGSWDDLLKPPPPDYLRQVEEIRNHIKENDLLTIIYTSGTTGTPKGVMLSHRNVMSNTESVRQIFPVQFGTSRCLSFLPLCHIFERTATYVYISCGVSIYYAENMETIGDNLKEVKPHIFTTVPRLLEKVYDKIIAKANTLSNSKKKLFYWALDLAMKYDYKTSLGFGYNLKLWIANKLVFSKWRAALGGNVISIVSGAAALQPRLVRIFTAANIKIMEAYGLTETSPGVCFTGFDKKDGRIGTVGPVIDGVQVQIAPDGEILVKGPNVMMGYFKRPELTAEVIKNGWFHTGDVGEWVDGRFLKITDRKKEMFKTSGGKYIAPQVLENKLKESKLIEQVMVVGEGKKFPAALVVPSKDELLQLCKDKNIQVDSVKEALNIPEIKQSLEKEIALANKNFAQFEQIKKSIFLADSWGIDSGELTPTLKLKRKIIEKKYQQQLDEIYSD